MRVSTVSTCARRRQTKRPRGKARALEEKKQLRGRASWPLLRLIRRYLASILVHYNPTRLHQQDGPPRHPNLVVERVHRRGAERGHQGEIVNRRIASPTCLTPPVTQAVHTMISRPTHSIWATTAALQRSMHAPQCEFAERQALACGAERERKEHAASRQNMIHRVRGPEAPARRAPGHSQLSAAPLKSLMTYVKPTLSRRLVLGRVESTHGTRLYF